MRKLNKMSKILIIISILALLFCVAGVYATNNDNNDHNWNVADGLKKTSENDICTSYKDGDYSFRICSKDDLSGYKKGFTKENETGMYFRFDVKADAINHTDEVAGYSNTLLGEYVNRW